ncbi:hypothetical protein ACJX0J_030473, partial [Zea mays]
VLLLLFTLAWSKIENVWLKVDSPSTFYYKIDKLEKDGFIYERTFGPIKTEFMLYMVYSKMKFHHVTIKLQHNYLVDWEYSAEIEKRNKLIKKDEYLNLLNKQILDCLALTFYMVQFYMVYSKMKFHHVTINYLVDWEYSAEIEKKTHITRMDGLVVDINNLELASADLRKSTGRRY